MKRFEIVKDRYRKTRGGYSRILDVSCSSCSNHICFYQKDGPGILKRLYTDRIHEYQKASELVCQKCKSILGVYYIYQKEMRPAYRLFIGAVKKKILKNNK